MTESAPSRLRRTRLALMLAASHSGCATSQAPLQQGAELLGGTPQRGRHDTGGQANFGQVKGTSAFALGAIGSIKSPDETARLAILYRRLLMPYLELQIGTTVPGWPTLQTKGLLAVSPRLSLGWLGGFSYANIDLGTIGRREVLRRHQATLSTAFPATWRSSPYFAVTAAPRLAAFASVGDGARFSAEPAFAINVEVGASVGTLIEVAVTRRRTGIVDGSLSLSYVQRSD